MAGEHSDDSRVWFEVRGFRDRVVVTVGGQVDYHTAVGLGDTVEAAAGISSHLVIDLSQVSFIDSTGLSTLISARRNAVERGGSVSIVHGPHVVRGLLARTRPRQFESVYDSPDDDLSAN